MWYLARVLRICDKVVQQYCISSSRALTQGTLWNRLICFYAQPSAFDTSLLYRGDAYLICSPTTLPHVRKLLDAVASADMSDSASCSPKCCVNAVTSNLRGQHLCRFFLEAVHVLLPLVRRWRETPKSLASCAFVDVAAILLRCTLRGHQVRFVSTQATALERSFVIDRKMLYLRHSEFMLVASGVQ